MNVWQQLKVDIGKELQMENIEIGKVYKCERCGKEEECKDSCYGTTYTSIGDRIICRDCDMEQFFAQYGTARD